MYKKLHTIHMIGIGGAGMCGIAEVLLNLGYKVTGSDISDSGNVKRLRASGGIIHLGHSADNIGNDINVVVKSSAIRDDNPEVIAAHMHGIPVIPRAEMLSELMRLHTGIAVAGTHGKTTTTSLIATIFDTAGLDPTVIIGGRLNSYGTNARLGKGDYLIAEADESDGSFLCLLPIINVITNVDADHLDHYGNLTAIEDAFVDFMNKVPFYGKNFVCGDNIGVQRILPRAKRPYTTYGFNEDNYIRANIKECGIKNIFDVIINGENMGEATLAQPGRHNILNALAAIGVSMEAEIPIEKCMEGLSKFNGVARRFDLKGEKDGVTVIDDYGHHPTEIAATLKTIKSVYPNRRIVVAFQPHRFTRTQALFGDFCTVFKDVDKLLLVEIYPAAERPIPGVNSHNLAQGINQVTTTDVECFKDIPSLIEALPSILKEGDVLLTLGAGNITTVGPAYLKG